MSGPWQNTGTDIYPWQNWYRHWGGQYRQHTKGTSLSRKVEVPEPADPVNVCIELMIALEAHVFSEK